MNDRFSIREDAFAVMALQLGAALTQFLSAYCSSHSARSSEETNDNELDASLESGIPDDPMSLAEVQWELRLKEKQIVALRRMWDFPRPWHDGAKLLFSRRAVMAWARAQPNQENLAAVLRLRRRRIARVVSGDVKMTKSNGNSWQV